MPGNCLRDASRVVIFLHRNIVDNLDGRRDSAEFSVVVLLSRDGAIAPSGIEDGASDRTNEATEVSLGEAPASAGVTLSG